MKGHPRPVSALGQCLDAPRVEPQRRHLARILDVGSLREGVDGSLVGGGDRVRVLIAPVPVPEHSLQPTTAQLLLATQGVLELGTRHEASRRPAPDGGELHQLR